jgi:DNA polymerase-3 subunit delta'
MAGMATDGLRTLLEGQPHARAVLGGVAAGTHELSHAYLISGPGGSGKRSLAIEIAALALAARSADGTLDAAAVDDSLRSRVANRKHPDLEWISPTGTGGLLVEEVEERVLSAAGSTPLVAARRVFILDQVERLVPASANRLLKTLEEPPPYVHLLLLTDDPEQVLPTIVSRCQPIRLRGQSIGQLAAALGHDGVEQTLALSAAGLASGDGDLARRLADPKTGGSLRAAAQQFGLGLTADAAAAAWQPLLDRALDAGREAADQFQAGAVPTAELLEGRELKSFEKAVDDRAKRADRQARTAELDEGLRLTAAWLRDLWALALDAPDIVLAQDRIDILHRELSRLAATDTERRALAPRLAECVAAVERARGALRTNATEPLLLDALMIECAGLLRNTPALA